MNQLLDGIVRFEQVKGVGTIEIDFVPNQQVYTFIGANGVGKTKLLECLFTVLLCTLDNIQYHTVNTWVDKKNLPLKQFTFLKLGFSYNFAEANGRGSEGFNIRQLIFELIDRQAQQHTLPIVYLSAQNRGYIHTVHNSIAQIGTHQQRLDSYVNSLFAVLREPERFKSLNMDVDLAEWIIQRAQSANPYQQQADNRKIELDTLLSVLNQIDKRIDSQFLEISGDNRVFLKVEGQKRELTELSSGFTSVLKMVQSIIAGYSYFTNEQQINRVRGVVLIDEIESHLHNEWQVKIIPLLKTLFPNTIFVISTHSSLVISQLEQGEAYRLARNEQGVVQSQLIDYPSNTSFVDLLNEAFQVNLNQLKMERAEKRDQKAAKQALLQLVQQELQKMEAQ